MENDNLNPEKIKECENNDSIIHKKRVNKLSLNKLAKAYQYYFDCDEHYTKSLLILNNLQVESEILLQRNETKEKYLSKLVFIEYVNGKSIETLSKQFEISVRKVQNLIRNERLKLKNDILTDIENGTLRSTHEVLPTKKLTNREMTKEINRKLGLNIPLRKKSKTEKLNDWNKTNEVIENIVID